MGRAMGFEDGRRIDPQGFVSGAGTASSDSIPARLSDGEYVLPADTVRAVGVDRLDALRAATHTPARGFSAQRSGELFFADGGLVDERELAQQARAAAGMRLRAPRMAAKMTDNQRQGRGLVFSYDDGRPEDGRPESARLAEQMLVGPPATAGQASRQALLRRQFDQAQQREQKALSIWRSDQAQQKELRDAAAAAPDQASQLQAAQPAAQEAKPVQAAGAGSADGALGAQPMKNNIVRQGNAYSGTDIGPGATINGGQGAGGFHVMGARAFGNADVHGVRAARGFAPGGQDAAGAAAPAPARGFNGAMVVDAGPFTAEHRQARAQRMAADRARWAAQDLQRFGSGVSGRDVARLMQQGMSDHAQGARHDASLGADAVEGAADRQAQQRRDHADRQFEAQKLQQQWQQAQWQHAPKIEREQRINALERRLVAQQTPKEELPALRQALGFLQGRDEQQGAWKPVVLQGGMDAEGNRRESLLGAVNERTGEMRRYDATGGAQPVPKDKAQLQEGQMYKAPDGQLLRYSNGLFHAVA